MDILFRLNAYAHNAKVATSETLLGMLTSPGVGSARHLPAAVATERCSVATTPSTTATAATTTTTTTAAVATTATATATEATHLGQTRVNLLVGLTKHINEITGLFGVWDIVSDLLFALDRVGLEDLLSAVKRVMAVP